MQSLKVLQLVRALSATPRWSDLHFPVPAEPDLHASFLPRGTHHQNAADHPTAGGVGDADAASDSLNDEGNEQVNDLGTC